MITFLLVSSMISNVAGVPVIRRQIGRLQIHTLHTLDALIRYARCNAVSIELEWQQFLEKCIVGLISQLCLLFGLFPEKFIVFSFCIFLVNLFIFGLFPEKNQSFQFLVNLFIFGLFRFPAKFRLFSFSQFSVLGEFVYFWTFPGKIQSCQFCLFLEFSRKNSAFSVFPVLGGFVSSWSFEVKHRNRRP